MTAPNIVNVTTITGKTKLLNLSTQGQAIVENSGQSGKVFKVNALYVANVDGTSNFDFSAYITDTNATAYIAKTIVVPADATLDVISKSIYLEEGATLYVVASGQGGLDAVCSYEEIS